MPVDKCLAEERMKLRALAESGGNSCLSLSNLDSSQVSARTRTARTGACFLVVA